MTDHLEYDATAKSRIKQELYEFLYGPTNAAFAARLDKIVEANNATKSRAWAFFRFRGVTYFHSQAPRNAHLSREIVTLDPALHSDMESYIEDLSKVNDRELPYVMGYINAVLNRTDHLPDFYDLFPDAFHGVLDKVIQKCPCRTRLLPDEKIQSLLSDYKESITLMKQRLVKNMIIK